MIPKAFLTKTVLIVAAVSAVSVAAAIGSMFVSPNNIDQQAKKIALEENKFSAAQMPAAIRCYDNLVSIAPEQNTTEIGKTCKCLVREIGKFAPAVQPALQNLTLISLDASARTSDAGSRNEFIRAAFSKDEVLQSLKPEQNPIVQSGINTVFKNCPLPKS